MITCKILRFFRTQVAFGAACLTFSIFAFTSAKAQTISQSHPRAGFIENKGQWPENVLYLYRAGALDLWITKTGATYDFYRNEFDSTRNRPVHPRRSALPARRIGHVVSMKFDGASDSAIRQSDEPLPGIFNFFIGNDSTKWVTNVRAYSSATIKNIYPGIDARFYLDSTEGPTEQPRYDFIVQPGADPSRISLAFRGQNALRADQDRITLGTSLGDVEERDLFAYQSMNGARVSIPCQFSKVVNGSVALELGGYDPTALLVIDPLIYSTFLGVNIDVYSNSIAVDRAEDAYITGQDFSSNFPTTPGAYQTTFGDSTDAFITKLNQNGSDLIYSTYLGGSGQDGGVSIALDSADNAYISGYSSSPNYPTTPGAFLQKGGGDGYIVVTKLNGNGTALLYSTYIGLCVPEGFVQADFPGLLSAIAVDTSGCAYITGSTAPIYRKFPTTPGAFGTVNHTGNYDAFVTKINPTGTALIYSAIFGGTKDGYGINEPAYVAASIALDPEGDAYICGQTNISFINGASNYPTTSGAYQDTNINPRAQTAAFVTELNSAGSALVYSTFLGGNVESASASGVAVDNAGNAYVIGGEDNQFPNDTSKFPTTPGVFLTSTGAPSSYIVKLNATGTNAIYSTLLGDSIAEYGGGALSGITLDPARDVYVTGATSSQKFPTTIGAYQSSLDGNPGTALIFCELDPMASHLIYSTYLGGDNAAGSAVARDSAGNIYLTGFGSNDYPTTPNTFVTQYDGGAGAFVTKIGLGTLAFEVTEATATACSVGTDSILWENMSGGFMAIDSIVTSSPFQAPSQLYPVWLNNGGTTLFPIGVADANGGPASGIATIYYRTQDTIGQDTPHDTSVQLAATIIPAIPLNLTFGTLQKMPDSSIELPIYFDSLLNVGTEALGVQSMTLTLHLNTDLLTPVRISSADAEVSVSTPIIGKDSVTFTVTFSIGYLTDTATKGIIVTFKSYATDSLSTAISLSVPALAFDSTAPCYAINLPAPVTFTNSDCGDLDFSEALSQTPPFSIGSIDPNPTRGIVNIMLIKQSPSISIEYEVLDLLGTVLQSGMARDRLDLSMLPSGNYCLRYNAEGFVQTQKIIVAR